MAYNPELLIPILEGHKGDWELIARVGFCRRDRSGNVNIIDAYRDNPSFYRMVEAAGIPNDREDVIRFKDTQRLVR